MSLAKRSTAEFIGTFWLVFGGCGTAVLAAAFPGVGIGLLGVSAAFGLTVLTMAFAIGQYLGMPSQSGGERWPCGGGTLQLVRSIAVHDRAAARRHRCSGAALPHSE